MKYVSIDIETTGLDKEQDQILQIALVVEDTETATEVPIIELPHWQCLIKHERISGNLVALRMNAEIIEALSYYKEGEAELRGAPIAVYGSTHTATWDALSFVGKHHPLSQRKYIAAGKNAAGFDLPFIGGEFQKWFHHRVIDAGSVALGASAELWKEDAPPSLSNLLPVGTCVEHDALSDARDVVRAIRTATNDYSTTIRRECRLSDA